MSESKSTSRFKKIVRGLGTAVLVILLLFQLLLLWVANNQIPVRLPESVSQIILHQVEQKGVKIQARNLWIQPDLSLAIDDMSAEIEGITGEIFTAERVEFQISPSNLFFLKISPQRFNLRGGKIVCPASISQTGEKHLLLEDLRVDLVRKGNWLMAPICRTRTGNFVISLEGELPLNLLSIQNNTFNESEQTSETIAQSTRRHLSALEEIVALTKEAGGGSIQIDANGEATGGAELKLQAVLANHEIKTGAPNFQASTLEVIGSIQINKKGLVDKWSLQSAVDYLSYKNYSIKHVIVEMSGAEQNRLISGHIIGVDGSLPQLDGIQFRAKFTPQIINNVAGIRAIFESQSRESEAVGELSWVNPSTSPVGEFLWKINYAQISANELNAFPGFKDLLQQSRVRLNGYIGLSQAVIEHGQYFKSAEGEISFTGLDALGISQRSLSSNQDLAMITRFSFLPERKPFPLQLRNLQLTTLRGELDCALETKGEFNLRLRGDVHPNTLNEVLGQWWVDTWKMFEIKKDPRATIDVVGRWGDISAAVKGRVRMDDFTLLTAPFRRVTLSVDTSSEYTRIGIEELAGGKSEEDGAVHGSIAWDWRKPAALAGPVISLRGNLQPWIAADCSTDSFAEILKKIELPSSHSFDLFVTPTENGLNVEANAECIEPFKAWGVESRNFKINVVSKNNVISARSSFILADGNVKFELTGKNPHESEVFLELKNCDTLKITRLTEKLKGVKSGSVEMFKPGSNLNFNFHGTVDIDNPMEVKGLGAFDLYSPDLKKIRLLGGLSAILESLGIEATTYTLDHINGHFGCTDGTAYFPDLMIMGSQSYLGLNGEIHLKDSEVDFNGQFTVPKSGSFTPLQLLNLSRNLVNNTKITVKGPISTPKTDANPPWLSLFFKSIIKKDLGKIPDSLME
jgi:hypothetical protein